MKPYFFAPLLGLVSCGVLLGPELCGAEREEYECDGEVLVFCESANSPLVQVDCEAQGLFCDAVNETCRACGNGIEEPGEVCDDGNTESGDGCGAECLDTAVCGNANVEADEQCDDGNAQNGDGCSSFCRLENAADCGNNQLDAGEQCDDGNILNGDGCNDTCQFENETIFNCEDDQEGIITEFANASNGDIIAISGQCNLGAISIISKNLTVRGEGPTTIIENSSFLIQTNSKVVFRDIDFSVSTEGNAKIIKSDNPQVAVINSTIEDTNATPGSRYIECVGGSEMLLDRVTMQNHGGDRGIKVDFSTMFIANSVFVNSRASNRDTIEIKGTSGVEVSFSTFFNNVNSTEEGIVDITGGFALNSTVASNNGGNPIDGLPLVSEFNIIEDEALLSGSINEDPLINDQTFEIEPGSPATNAGNPFPLIAPFVFDPFFLFGVNVFDHDRNNNPRGNGNIPDAGAFEIF